jgi:hypothetical protein
MVTFDQRRVMCCAQLDLRHEADLVRDDIGSHVLVVQVEEEGKGEGVGHGDKPPIKVLHGLLKEGPLICSGRHAPWLLHALPWLLT